MFRISIRQWMVAILTVGIGLGWCYDRLRLIAELQESAERVELLEWQPREVYTMSGSWNDSTIEEAIQEDEVQRKRFARQFPPKSETMSRKRQSSLLYVTHPRSSRSSSPASSR